MEQLLSTIKTIAAMSVLGMLLEFLAPDGNLKESVRLVIGLVFLLVVSQPILAVFQ